jgi:hypothetical protein
VAGVIGSDAVKACACAPGDRCAVIKRLVCLGVDQHCALSGEYRDHRSVDQCYRGQNERVGCTEELSKLLLDFQVGTRVPEQPGPAGVGTPLAHGPL